MRNRSQNKSLGARVGDIMLSVLSVAGGLSIILVIVGLTMNVSIMMFRTGSMDPTIPAGSIALVREIPATEMHKGDIITIDRGTGLLPVTHRVTEINDIAEDTGAVTFVMRGDANEHDDPEPYMATTVQRTMFSIPGMAPIIQSLQNPLALGGLTLGATTLVIWAFWPRQKKHDTKDSQAAPSRSPIVQVGDPVIPQHPRSHTVSPLHSVIINQSQERRSGRHSQDGVPRV